MIDHQKRVCKWDVLCFPSYAEIVVGLKDGWSENVYSDKKASQIVQESLQISASRVGLSCIKQLGIYEGTKEPSLKFTIFPIEGQKWDSFKNNIKVVVESLVKGLNQKEVYLSFYNEGMPSEFMSCKYVDKE